MASWRTNVRDGIFNQLNTTLSGYSVKWPNAKFDTPNNVTWLKPTIIFPSENFRYSVNETDTLNFFVQLDVFLPKAKGDREAYVIADLIDSSFPINGTPITYNSQNVTVKSISAPKPMPIGSNQDDAWDRYVIYINLHAFVSRL